MRALVTGCSSGIGRATVRELADRGLEVVATARRPETLIDLPAVESIALDVTDDTSVDEAKRRAGRVDVLVNSAGFAVGGPVEKVPLNEVRRLFETNVLGTMRVIQAFVPPMRERRSGVIVNISSMLGRVSSPLAGCSAASKHALEALSESLHYELGHFGLRVRIIEPGVFETRIQENSVRYGIEEPPYDELYRRWESGSRVLSGADRGRRGPEVVARVVADAVQSKEPRLRWPVGDDAEMVLAARAAMNDEAFEQAMRATLNFDW